MKIALFDVDRKNPNLALMKISAYHKSKGDEVYLFKTTDATKRLIDFDKVYISCVFDYNKKYAMDLLRTYPNAEIGGIAINNNKLPSEINHLKPDYDLYNINYSMGFTSRGCIRKCEWCKVANHEGQGLSDYSDIYEFWDKKHKEIVLMDNNILSNPEHFKKIAQQIKENNLIVDFNSGFDHRLLTDELMKIILSLKHKEAIRFAFDHISYEKSVIRALKILKDNNIKDWQTRWYVYVGEKDDFYSVYNRLKLLKEYKQNAYVMIDTKVKNSDFKLLEVWANFMGLFKMGELNEMIIGVDRLKNYRQTYDKYLGEKKQKGLDDFKTFIN